MKKLMSLVLGICMLLTLAMPAMAETAVQDEMAPVLVASDVALTLTDVSARAAAANLQAAYNAMMAGVHVSDAGNMKALLGENVYAMVATEIFDVALAEGAAVAEGAAIAMTFEGAAPAAVVVSADGGANWKAASVAANGATFTVTTEELGTMVFLTLDTATITTEEVVYAQDVYTVFDYEVPFTPSVSGKPEPVIVVRTVAGEPYIAAINSDSETTVYIADDNTLIVTPYAKRAEAEDITTFELLKWAYNDVEAAGAVSALNVAADIDAALAGTGLTSADMIVRDLFEISMYGDAVKALYAEGACVDMTFDAGITPEMNLVVLCCCNGQNWHVVPASEVTVNADGTVDLCMDDLGAIAFLVSAAEVAADAVASPM